MQTCSTINWQRFGMNHIADLRSLSLVAPPMQFTINLPELTFTCLKSQSKWINVCTLKKRNFHNLYFTHWLLNVNLSLAANSWDFCSLQDEFQQFLYRKVVCPVGQVQGRFCLPWHWINLPWASGQVLTSSPGYIL